MPKTEFDVIISGAGAIGIMTALLLAKRGLKIALIDPKSLENIAKMDDSRNIALMQSSLNMFKYLDIFDVLLPFSKPLKQLHIVDASKRLLRAPEILFDASELQIDYFALNVPIGRILAVLSKEIKKYNNIECLFKDHIEHVEHINDGLTITLNSTATLNSKLLIGADGRNSIARKFAQISTKTKHYPQTALGFTFNHERELGDISIEFHRSNGPFTLIPMKNPKTGYQTSLVWSENHDQAQYLKQLPKDEIANLIENITNGIVGKITKIGHIASFPLSNISCDTLANNRIILAGEAAHILPPIGAQGMNLGIQDAAIIDEIIGNAHQKTADIGNDEIMNAYNRYRKTDVKTRSKAVDLLNISLLNDDIHIQFMRGMGLFLLQKSQKLRVEVMKKALYPLGKTPKSML